MINLNCQMDRILCQIVNIILTYFDFKIKHNKKIDNSSLKLHVNKIEKRITCTIKTGYYLELLIPQTIKFLGCTENKKQA